MTSTPLTFRGRLWRWTKRLTATVALLLVAAVPAGYYGLPALARHEKARARVEKALTRAFGAPVQIGAMSFCWHDGLFLRDVSTPENPSGSSFRIDAVTLQPRWSKLLSGKVRFRAELESPEIVVVDAGREIRHVRLPKFGRKGLQLEHVKIVDGTYLLKSGADDRTIRIEKIATEGTGRLQNRSVRMDLKSLSGSYNGVAVTGKGLLRLTQDGFAGELDVNDDAAKEPELQAAFRAAGLTLRKAPVLSDPF